MSGASTQGVGAAACANADVVIAVSAAAIESVFFENSPRVEKSLGEERVGVEDWVMMHAPGDCSNCLEQTTNIIRPSIRGVRSPPDVSPRLCDFPASASRLCCRFSL